MKWATRAPGKREGSRERGGDRVTRAALATRTGVTRVT